MNQLNKQQCESIMSTTCYILDSNEGIEERLKAFGILPKDLKKIEKALNLINEVNQTYTEMKRSLKA